jgi:hypothetical protein
MDAETQSRVNTAVQSRDRDAVLKSVRFITFACHREMVAIVPKSVQAAPWKKSVQAARCSGRTILMEIGCIIIMHLLGQAPEGWLATPKPTTGCGSHGNRSSEIPNSLQFGMNCQRPVITLAPPEDPLKQCQQDLVTSPKLCPGLLPFLDESSGLRKTSTLN